MPRQSLGRGRQKSIRAWALWFSKVVAVFKDEFRAIHPLGQGLCKGALLLGLSIFTSVGLIFIAEHDLFRKATPARRPPEPLPRGQCPLPPGTPSRLWFRRYVELRSCSVQVEIGGHGWFDLNCRAQPFPESSCAVQPHENARGAYSKSFAFASGHLCSNLGEVGHVTLQN